MADETLYAFNYSDSEALLAGIGKKRQGGQIASDAISDNTIYIGVATTVITARAGTTLGTGTAMLKRISDANVLSDLHSVSVVNAGAAIANGSHMLAFRIGNKFAEVELC